MITAYNNRVFCDLVIETDFNYFFLHNLNCNRVASCICEGMSNVDMTLFVHGYWKLFENSAFYLPMYMLMNISMVCIQSKLITSSVHHQFYASSSIHSIVITECCIPSDLVIKLTASLKIKISSDQDFTHTNSRYISIGIW